MNNYTHIFFDLDRTLWDYEANSSAAFSDIIQLLKLETAIYDVELFKKKYDFYNEILWDQYRKGLIQKDYLSNERFYRTLLDFNIDNKELAEIFGEKYIEITPTKSHLVPNCMETITYLKKKGYSLHIITNGFQEIQFIKMKSSNIYHFFDTIITSEEVGYQKPHEKIFEYSLNACYAKKTESIMIGDDFEVDVEGAANFGIDQVFYKISDGEEQLRFQPTYIVKDIYDLINIL